MFRLPHRTAAPSIAVALLLMGSLYAPAQSRIAAVRFWSFGDVTRIAIQTEGEYKLDSDQIENPSRVYFDLNGLRPPVTAHHGIQTIAVKDRLVRQIRIAEVSPARTRVVFDLEGPVEVISSQLVNPDRLIIEIRPKGTSLPALSASTHNATGPQALSSPSVPTTTNASFESREAAYVGEPPHSQVTEPTVAERVTTVQRPDGLVVQQVYTAPLNAAPATNLSPARTPLSSAPYPAAPPPVSAPATAVPITSKVVGVAAAAKRDATGDRSLVRVFGLKLGKVVIDAGHGGHDTGTIGPHGLMEKDLVLDVALRLGRLITQQLGAQVIYTRSDDTFIPLEARTQLANSEKADLFISIHANSSPEPSATGVETYFFNFNSDRAGLDLATRENATSASSISDLNDLLHKAVLQTKLEESRDFAQRVQSSLWASSVKMNNRSRDRGVRQAPFVVLIGATMPSILAEIGFVSNPHDERLLERSEQRQKIADALFKGVSQYAASLSHVQLARTRTE